MRCPELPLKSTAVKHLLAINHSNVFICPSTEVRFLSGTSEPRVAALKALRME